MTSRSRQINASPPLFLRPSPVSFFGSCAVFLYTPHWRTELSDSTTCANPLPPSPLPPCRNQGIRSEGEMVTPRGRRDNHQPHTTCFTPHRSHEKAPRLSDARGGKGGLEGKAA